MLLNYLVFCVPFAKNTLKVFVGRKSKRRSVIAQSVQFHHPPSSEKKDCVISAKKKNFVTVCRDETWGIAYSGFSHFSLGWFVCLFSETHLDRLSLF